MDKINFFVVFIEGVLSIFSPCILPIYLSMLSNSSVDEIKSSKSKVLIINTFFFTLGISLTFFILGFSINALGSFFNTYRNLIMIIGGIIITIMGLFYVGFIKSSLLSREKRISLEYKTMGPTSAFILGFTYSFGWTPCIGPILASVLIMTASSESILTGNILILVYTMGFILPFIIVALFYSKLYKRINKLKEYMEVIKKISGFIIILAGVVMIVNGGINYYKSVQAKNPPIESKEEDKVPEEEEEEKKDKISAIDFELYDQYGNIHRLSDYKGKIIFLNFWATWCPPCREEMPYIDELAKEYEGTDVAILGVAAPNLGREGTQEYITEFLEDEGYSFNVLMDVGGDLTYKYAINAFPTTFIINKDGDVEGYIPGAMNKETMKRMIEDVR